jgi:hypothetical protein
VRVLAAFGVPRSAFRVSRKRKQKHRVFFADLSDLASSFAKAREDRLAKEDLARSPAVGVLFISSRSIPSFPLDPGVSLSPLTLTSRFSGLPPGCAR